MNTTIQLLQTKKVKSILKIVFIIAFIGFILFEGRKELASIKIEDVETVLKSLSIYAIIFFLFGGILASTTGFIHDNIISKELTICLSNIKIFKISFISNTINNALGGFSSAGARGMLYVKEGISPKESTYYNILIVSSFSAGLSLLTWLALLNFKTVSSIFHQYKFALISTIIIIFYAPLYFMINKLKWIKKKLLGEDAEKIISYHLLEKLFISSVFEWTITGIFFSIIALHFAPNAKFIDIFSVFIISSVIGVVSLVPGAIGAFDLTVLLGMSTIGIGSHKGVATLLMFRLFYYIIPLILALLISLPDFFKKRVN